ncbi:MAG: hypothetical protein Q9M75_03245 [Ghiorsea sp.]|nr:hypothetical protein [Ghiorsea sp.]
MNLKKIVTTAAIAGALTMGAAVANASTVYMDVGGIVDQKYPGANITNSCFICHTGTPGAMTSYGNQFKNVGGTGGGLGTVAQLTAIDGLDADGDGTTTGTEITNATGTGNTDVIVNPNAPAASSSGGGCVTSSVTTPLMMVLAMLSLGFFVRRKKD